MARNDYNEALLLLTKPLRPSGNYVFSRCGLPKQLVSDNGPQFTSEAFATFMKANGIKHTRSAPYHPSTNGLAERFIQSMKQALKASLSNGKSLEQRLCSFLLLYRNTTHSTTGATPSFLFLKREVRTRFDLLKPDIDKQVTDKQSRQKENRDKNRNAKERCSGPDWVKAIVTGKLGPLSYLVETIETKLLWRRHVDHLKKLEAKPESLAAPEEADLEETDPDDEVIDLSPAVPNSSPSVSSPSPPATPPPPVNAPHYSLRTNTRPPDYFEP